MTTKPAGAECPAHSLPHPDRLSPSVRTAGRRILVRLGAAAVLATLAALAHFAADVWLPVGLVEPAGLGKDARTAVQALTVPLLLLLAAVVTLASAVNIAVRTPQLATAPGILARAAWNSAGVLAAGAIALMVSAPLALYGLLGAFWVWPGHDVVALLVYGVPVLMVAAGFACAVRSVWVVRSRPSRTP